MKVLVLNCGSSSIKYKLFEMTTKEVLAQGGIEKIGLPGSFLKLTLCACAHACTIMTTMVSAKTVVVSTIIKNNINIIFSLRSCVLRHTDRMSCRKLLQVR